MMIITNTIKYNHYRQSISRLLLRVASYSKQTDVKQYAQPVLITCCEIAGSVFTWILLKDNRILVSCLAIMLLCIGYVVSKHIRDIESLCHIFAACCALLVMLSLFAGWTIEDIAPTIGVIISALVSLTASGYFIYRPRSVY